MSKQTTCLICGEQGDNATTRKDGRISVPHDIGISKCNECNFTLEATSVLHLRLDKVWNSIFHAIDIDRRIGNTQQIHDLVQTGIASQATDLGAGLSLVHGHLLAAVLERLGALHDLDGVALQLWFGWFLL